MLGIFLSPILYQSIHIVWHTLSVEKEDVHSCCHEQNISNSSAIPIISNQQDICPVCNYQFSVNDLSAKQNFEFILQEIFILFKENKKSAYEFQIFYLNSNRAPPLLV